MAGDDCDKKLNAWLKRRWPFLLAGAVAALALLGALMPVIDPEWMAAQDTKRQIEEARHSEEKTASDRKRQIARYFDDWDGSYIPLKKLVKESMFDPSSFKCDHSESLDAGDHLIVTMYYSGKNAYGARVRGMIKARCSFDGEVLNVIEAY